MKISQVPSTANTAPTQHGGLEVMRSMKMRTNATPGTYTPDAQSPIAQNPAPADNGEGLASANEDTKPISPQFARLAKERRALQVQARELEAKRQELEARSQGRDHVAISQLKQEPLKVLLENGVTYEQLTQAILANPVNPELAELKSKLQALEQGVDERFKTQATQQEQQVLAEMGREATQLVAEGEEFALVRELNHIPKVLDLIEKTYRKTGEVLDVKEALGLMEAELFKDAQRIANLEKLRPQMPAPQQQVQRQPVMRTLTNKDTASIPLSSKQRALAAFHGTLKK